MIQIKQSDTSYIDIEKDGGNRVNKRGYKKSLELRPGSVFT